MNPQTGLALWSIISIMIALFLTGLCVYTLFLAIKALKKYLYS